MRSFKAILVLVAAGATGSALAVDTPVGLDAIEQFDQIATLRQGVRTYQYSSHDPGGGNDDRGFYLNHDLSTHIMLDVKGPGCIYRIWATGLMTGRIKVYFDGLPTPLVDMDAFDFFSGTHAPFLAPLVGNDLVSSGGFYCYLPMPFREGCKIINTGTALYYHVTYQRFADAEGAITFTGTEDSSIARGMWQNAGTDPKSDHGALLITDTVALPVGASVTMADIASPGSIQQLEITIPGLSPGATSKTLLTGLRLQGWWDDSSTAAIDVPVGDFFGSGLGAATVDGLVVGMDGSRLYCYYPMPFARAALVRLVNNSTVSVASLTYKVRYNTFAEPLPGVGYFHARAMHENPMTSGRDFLMLEESGAGHVVGIVQTMHGQTGSQDYLEGDERIYVDSGLTPVLYGTGTEDFYNGGWYFSQGPFTLPVHGAPTWESASPYAHTCYRLLLSDLIPFTNGIHVGIEHGPQDDVPADYRSVAMYYHVPESSGWLTDELDVGGAGSEALHHYTATNQTWAGTTVNTYEGDNDDVAVSDDGRRLATGCEFTVVVSPKNNAGVLLRRRMDYSFPYQEARVYVDNVLAGHWYDPGDNPYHIFRDSEFMVPMTLTEGKSEITVRIENASTQSDWTEYRYWVYTLLPVNVLSSPQPDFDRDGDVDQEDFGHFQECLSGSGMAQTKPVCANADFDHDNDVDDTDFGVFADCMSGAGIPADSACDD